MSQQYRKRPVVIEAMQYNAVNCADLHDWLGLAHRVYPGEPCGVGQIIIPTLEGQHVANPGDWIIKGVEGEFYPCKPSIFAKTYEVAQGSPTDG